MRLSPPPRRCLRRATRACAPDFGATLERRRPIGRPDTTVIRAYIGHTCEGGSVLSGHVPGWHQLAARSGHGHIHIGADQRTVVRYRCGWVGQSAIDGALRCAALCQSAADSNATACRAWPSHAQRSRRRLALFSTGLQTHGGVTPPPACNRWLECHLSRCEGWLCHAIASAPSRRSPWLFTAGPRARHSTGATSVTRVLEVLCAL